MFSTVICVRCGFCLRFAPLILNTKPKSTAKAPNDSIQQIFKANCSRPDWPDAVCAGRPDPTAHRYQATLENCGRRSRPVAERDFRRAEQTRRGQLERARSQR